LANSRFFLYAAGVLELPADVVMGYWDDTSPSPLATACKNLLTKLYNKWRRASPAPAKNQKRAKRKFDLNVKPAVRLRLIRLRGCCEQCGAKTHLQVHHKRPRSLGGDDSDDNLMLLCHKCHFETYHRPGKYGIHTLAVVSGACPPPLLAHYPT